MIRFSIKTNFPEVQRKLEALRKDIAERATVSAINKTTTQAKSQMSRAITGEFNIAASKVKESLRVVRARYSFGGLSIEARLESPSTRGRSLNLINFDAKQTAKGVSVKVRKASGRKLIAGAFIANKGRTVFQRQGGVMPSRSRYKGTKHAEQIKALQTIEVAQMFNTKRINAKVVQFIEAKLPEVMANEIRFFTSRFNAK